MRFNSEVRFESAPREDEKWYRVAVITSPSTGIRANVYKDEEVGLYYAELMDGKSQILGTEGVQESGWLELGSHREIGITHAKNWLARVTIERLFSGETK